VYKLPKNKNKLQLLTQQKCGRTISLLSRKINREVKEIPL